MTPESISHPGRRKRCPKISRPPGKINRVTGALSVWEGQHSRRAEATESTRAGNPFGPLCENGTNNEIVDEVVSQAPPRRGLRTPDDEGRARADAPHSQRLQPQRRQPRRRQQVATEEEALRAAVAESHRRGGRRWCCRH